MFPRITLGVIASVACLVTGCSTPEQAPDRLALWRAETLNVLASAISSSNGPIPEIWLPHGHRSILEQSAAILALDRAGVLPDQSLLAQWRTDRRTARDQASGLYSEDGQDTLEVTWTVLRAALAVGEPRDQLRLAQAAATAQRVAAIDRPPDLYRALSAERIRALALEQPADGGEPPPQPHRACVGAKSLELFAAAAQLTSLQGQPCPVRARELNAVKSACAQADKAGRQVSGVSSLGMARIESIVRATEAVLAQDSDPTLSKCRDDILVRLRRFAEQDKIEPHPITIRIYTDLVAAPPSGRTSLGVHTIAVLHDVLKWGSRRGDWAQDLPAYVSVAESIELLSADTTIPALPDWSKLRPAERLWLMVKLVPKQVQRADVTAAASELATEPPAHSPLRLNYYAALALASKRLGTSCEPAIQDALSVAINEISKSVSSSAAVLRRSPGSARTVLATKARCSRLSDPATQQLARFTARSQTTVRALTEDNSQDRPPGIVATADAIEAECQYGSISALQRDAVERLVGPVLQPEGGASTTRFDVDPLITRAVAYLLRVQSDGCPG
jgi:hypothetical protein